MLFPDLASGVLRYIVEHQLQPGQRLPTISELSQELGVSVSKIREELEVARALGLVQVKPRTGTQVRAFDFAPTVTLGVLYALGLDQTCFHHISVLRNAIELSFWNDAVQRLTRDDIAHLRELVARANMKLNRIPIEVPFEEHRQLHLSLFRHFDNPFVQGLLEAYWAAYKAFGMSLHAPLSYHREVWAYHERMVECVAAGNYEEGRQALKDHMALLRHAPEQESQREPSAVYHFFE